MQQDSETADRLHHHSKRACGIGENNVEEIKRTGSAAISGSTNRGYPAHTEAGRKYWLISLGIFDGAKKTIRTESLENETELLYYRGSSIVRAYRITQVNKPSRKEI